MKRSVESWKHKKELWRENRKAKFKIVRTPSKYGYDRRFRDALGTF